MDRQMRDPHLQRSLDELLGMLGVGVDANLDGDGVVPSEPVFGGANEVTDGVGLAKKEGTDLFLVCPFLGTPAVEVDTVDEGSWKGRFKGDRSEWRG